MPFDDGTVGYACDGTPVDCVRLAALGLIEGFEPDVIVSGINHGANLGDDITYSGTVAAALEGIVLGIPGIAVSQQSVRREMDFRLGQPVRLHAGGRVHRARRRPARRRPAARPARCSTSTCRPGEIGGVEVARLGKRIYRDRLDLIEEDVGGRRLYRVYGDAPVHDDEPDTDLAAVAAGRIAVTPLHFDLTAEHGIEALRAYDLAQLLAPPRMKPTARPGPPSCASSSPTTATATTSSTTPRSATTPTTRCWTSCARSSASTPSC